ncbi:MAG: hypothetical protein HQL27_00050 [Candidatus Omnitrophica bacterium]|nr:hypothetical protein [Candidatus Omnitrophota bacterium]
MDLNTAIKSISQKISDLQESQKELAGQLSSLEPLLNKSLENQFAVNSKIKTYIDRRRLERAYPQGTTTAPEIAIQKTESHTLDTSSLEKLLQGSLDALGNKISDKLMGMLRELKSLPADVRYSRMQEIKQAADAELVDLSALYKYNEVQSNIEEVGVEEKETKGIDKNLERLRKLRQGKGK